MGMPRLLFVISAGCIGVILVTCVALGIMCFQQRKSDRSYYSFSMLPQKSDTKQLFADEDECDETEIFRTPIKSKFFLLILVF